MNKIGMVGASTLALVMTSSPLAAADLPTAVVLEREMIVTANPLASAAGAKILKNGGTAADAMVAAQAVLGLVEPSYPTPFLDSWAIAFSMPCALIHPANRKRSGRRHRHFAVIPTSILNRPSRRWVWGRR